MLHFLVVGPESDYITPHHRPFLLWPSENRPISLS